MRKYLTLLCITFVVLLSACEAVEPISAAPTVDLNQYTIRERREAFLEIVWGYVPSIGHFTSTPFPNISFTRTVARSFDDVFFFTLVMFEHHPYLINPDDMMEVYIAPYTRFNLLELPGTFEDVRRRVADDGNHIVTGFHNGIPFEIEFEEESYDD